MYDLRDVELLDIPRDMSTEELITPFTMPVQDNYCVTSAAVGHNVCLRAFSKLPAGKIHRQRLYCTDKFPEELIRKHWDQGWNIVAIATR